VLVADGGWTGYRAIIGDERLAAVSKFGKSASRELSRLPAEIEIRR